MLVCYLDDSGKDKSNPITTLAGFAATEDQWRSFEQAAEPIFLDHKVCVLHAKDLHSSDGEFANWSIGKKRRFVAALCNEMSRRVPLGLSMSAAKGSYAVHKAERAARGRKRTLTPYSFCFNVILDWVLRDVRIGKEAMTNGVAFILEAGNEHNSEAQQCFDGIRQQFGIHQVLRSIEFVPKTQCRAIQMADLIAFYSRRLGVQGLGLPSNTRHQVDIGPMMNIISWNVPIRAFVADQFYHSDD